MSEKTNIPVHVAIIMDGNGRWAQLRGQDRVYGHANGVESVRDAVKGSLKLGVRYLTLYAFSTENWGRPAAEVDALMELLCKSVLNEADELFKQGVRVTVIGDTTLMSEKVQQHLELIKTKTASADKLTLILALNYSSRWELTEAAKKIATEAKNGNLDIESIDNQTITKYLNTASYPDPDLLIRTGGDCRLSNFLLWQAAYSELFFTPVLWPDFKINEFEKAIAEYQTRERRYGLVK